MTDKEFFSFLGALAIALIGYFLNVLLMKRQWSNQSNKELSEAKRSILAEVKANLETAKKAHDALGKDRVMLPFVDDAWRFHRGKVFALSEEAQNLLHSFYLLIEEANGVVELNRRLSYNAGYVDNKYRDKVVAIIGKAEQLIKVIENS